MNAASTCHELSNHLDLLEHVAVLVPCAACGRRYEVSLRHVLLSQQMMHEGCPVPTETECLPLFRAPLAEREAVRDLERSWCRLSELVQNRGLDLTLRW